MVLFTPDGHEDRIGGFSSLVFWTDDIDATYAELQANGVETMDPPPHPRSLSCTEMTVAVETACEHGGRTSDRRWR